MATVEIHASPEDLARAVAALFAERAAGAVSVRGGGHASVIAQRLGELR